LVDAEVEMRRLLTVVGLAVFALANLTGRTAGAAAQTDQRVALVIGNGSYANVATLKNPANDARAMAATLRRAGFDLIEREDATRRTMIEALRAFSEKLSPGGVGLFFYAGHGIQSRGANYLIPIDATIDAEDDLRYETMDVQDVLNRLDDAKVRLSIVILDACRDTPFSRSFRSTTRGLAQIDAPRGTLIAYATAPGREAADGSGVNGVYTAELLKAMSEPGLKLQEVFERVVDAVERKTANAQTPWISSSFRGDFYFFGPTSVTIAQPGPQAPSASAETPEQAAWAGVVGSKTAAPYEAFLAQFPSGIFSGIARAKIDELKATKQQVAIIVPPSSGNAEPNSESPIALLALGSALDDRGRYSDAVAAYRRAADLGDPEAQFQLGRYYYNGLGVQQSYAEASRYLAMAAAKQHAKAQFLLGLLYCSGRGVPQSWPEAKRLFEMSNEPNAKYYLKNGLCR
jgi:uncharacterized caspase-like protein